MTVQAIFHGTPAEAESLERALQANCVCTFDDVGYRTACCPAHAMILDQKTLDHLLFVRRTAYRLLAQEFIQPAD